MGVNEWVVWTNSCSLGYLGDDSSLAYSSDLMQVIRGDVRWVRPSKLTGQSWLCHSLTLVNYKQDQSQKRSIKPAVAVVDSLPIQNYHE